MMIARWHIDAKFGHKQTVVDSLKIWNRGIAMLPGISSGPLPPTSNGARRSNRTSCRVRHAGRSCGWLSSIGCGLHIPLSKNATKT